MQERERATLMVESSRGEETKEQEANWHVKSNIKCFYLLALALCASLAWFGSQFREPVSDTENKTRQKG